MALVLKAPMSSIPAMDISYYELDQDLADFTLMATDRIQQRLLSAKMDIVEIGKDLLAVKEKLPHGLFGSWMEREFGWTTPKTAQNYMNVARMAAETTADVIELLPQKLAYELAAKSTPIQVRTAVLAEVETSGTPPQAAIVREKIAAAKTASAIEKAEQHQFKGKSPEEIAKAKKLKAASEKKKLAKQLKAQQAHEEAQQQATERARAVVEFVELHMGDHMPELRQLLAQADTWRVFKLLKAGDDQ